MEVKRIKENLLQHCKKHVENRMGKIKQTIADIEESLQEESKNTSGDKHETGRAMLQIDRENSGKQLMEIEKLANLLNRIDVNEAGEYVRLGSLVTTDKNIFFISISIGAVHIDGREYLCVALNSPIGSQLAGKMVGDSFIFNNQNITVKQIN